MFKKIFELLFGNKNSIAEVKISKSYGEDKYFIEETNREITKLKNKGDFAGAIKILETKISGNRLSDFHIDFLLRLPMLYQKNNQNDDSWYFLDTLSKEFFIPEIRVGYDLKKIGLTRILSLIKINDKQRLQLQKEKSYIGAIPYAIYADLLSAVSQFNLINEPMNPIQKGILENQFKDFILLENIENRAKTLLKNTDKIHLSEKIAVFESDIIFNGTYFNSMSIYEWCKKELL